MNREEFSAKWFNAKPVELCSEFKICQDVDKAYVSARVVKRLSLSQLAEFERDMREAGSSKRGTVESTIKY